MVFSVTKNALAISVVVSPQIVRNVRAICASSGRAGWQHVNIRRRTSSWRTLSAAEIFRKPFPRPLIGHEIGLDQLALGEKTHVPPQAVDRLVAADIHQPGTGIGGDAFAWPLHQRCGKGILHRIFG